MDGLEPFGTVWSAMWLHYDDGTFDFDQLQLTNLADGCERVTTYFAALDGARRATADLSEAGWCAAAREPYQAWATAGDALLHEGVHYVDLTLFHGEETAPIEATFGVQDSAHLLSGRVTYVESSPYRTYLDDWDVTGSPDDLCGIDEASLTGEAVVATLADGALDLSNVEAGAFAAGRLDAELVDIASGAPATLASTFRATWCEVDLPG